VVALVFVALLGAWYERGQRLNAMQGTLMELAARAEKSEKSEKDLRMVIDGFHGLSQDSPPFARVSKVGVYFSFSFRGFSRSRPICSIRPADFITHSKLISGTSLLAFSSR
jgi:hypothetical protein